MKKKQKLTKELIAESKKWKVTRSKVIKKKQPLRFPSMLNNVD